MVSVTIYIWTLSSGLPRPVPSPYAASIDSRVLGFDPRPILVPKIFVYVSQSKQKKVLFFFFQTRVFDLQLAVKLFFQIMMHDESLGGGIIDGSVKASSRRYGGQLRGENDQSTALTDPTGS